MPYRPISAMVLAAGEGTRMRSSRPKPLHLLCGKPMLVHVLDSLGELPIDRCVVVIGAGAEQVTKVVNEHKSSDLLIDFVEQAVAQGTGDAAAVGLTAFSAADLDDDGADIVLLPGDTPLLLAETLAQLATVHREEGAAATVLTARVEDPTGYGRVIRNDDGKVQRIIEQTDASPDEAAVNEINTSIYCFRRALLGPALRRLDSGNAQGEYYLTDVIEVLREAGYTVGAHEAPDATEAAGVNDRLQLATAESELRRRTNARWLAAGVTMLDPATVYIDSTVKLAADVTLFPETMLQGATVVGEGCEIGPGTRLVDSAVGARARVERSHAVDAEIGADAIVGPFVSIEPGGHVADGVRIGPFEVVK